MIPTDWHIREWYLKLSDAKKQQFDERAAIIQYDGGEEQMTAEVLAFESMAFERTG